MKKVTFKNIIWKEGKHYVAQCLNIDVATFGTTKKKALSNLNEALELYFEGESSHFAKNIRKTERSEIVTLPFRYA
ncbi:MAG: hypothetical protein UU88_C0013G0018 [Parcubacteria group bacterium GW2011_GWC1_42_11]|uniref:HicB family protein n=1 Tax=Candidatus Nomurabacteria bacterium GW2011_GWC2_42_20 TaxID=1618756 RepID=A0A0G0ZEB1_9BACT|nr:MAG: hypothetical protein UU88_C0013G0018 [Parcubacteria group bacterium GW2011_GWC1_42_11]KKS47019.1 MAG: hypothetical protein UV12_C0013G0002 [Candidatus Nomurabacteria bacterium GW2011_GWC2_42_20]KKS59224.1 MAG: hypothetical protein UV24_C0004G0002 [Candidatus Nomurabacteria bacterium GW2011_GWA2_42_41]KKT09159.1 MAG: hypothetical protein UV86_C0013G0002 [Candidatus Nomurabacteria bacterium GW2011_GWB1_43_20]